MKDSSPITTRVSVIKQLPWLQILLITITLLLAGLYIWQVSVSSTQGYAVREMQEEIEVMKRQNERLKMEVAKLQSVESVTTRMQMLGLVPVSQVKYLSGDSSVAMR